MQESFSGSGRYMRQLLYKIWKQVFLLARGNILDNEAYDEYNTKKVSKYFLIPQKSGLDL